jgi:prephenate dehydratase
MDTPKILLLGPQHSYHHQAVKKFLGYTTIPVNTEIQFTSSFNNIFSGVENGNIGIIATQNTISGLVEDNLKRVREYIIIANIAIKIEHKLILYTDTTLSNITRILLHPQSEIQCNIFLNSHNWAREHTQSTSQGAYIISQEGLKDTATIASKDVCDYDNLQYLDCDIMNENPNITSFIVFTK